MRCGGKRDRRWLEAAAWSSSAAAVPRMIVPAPPNTNLNGDREDICRKQAIFFPVAAHRPPTEAALLLSYRAFDFRAAALTDVSHLN
jgi:hypothetical protein